MIIVRNARSEDVRTLVEIGMRAWEQAVIGVADLDVLGANARNAFETFLVNNWLAVTVAERAGQTVGWAAREELDDQISDLWVEPALQRQGIGSRLLSAVEAEMMAAGYEAARLQTHARNEPAVAFFRARGYSVHWLSIVYSPKLDRDIESIGLSRQMVSSEPFSYGMGGL
ncbi:GNAT family N-acetyltransferase [Rhizobium sp. TRM95111]|uniref:GNAT family N-acetyltransferase n=1 Tax=Rhizobium alarense TaxID=2846851 RepID=UPI001F1D11C2|nr:N-acetyltransferase [Rhizobium alarense]MCF3641393.1 GNAT family N-acetyltransferase [Rhizobium alarense]